ncbi:hypothetical protein [Verrucosispora sp. WMMD573]|uniref:hypothetical protein n=1 Tax=Verrucosispora sp. WMMD573 TaxID=3015149 RepID=UPI00248B5B8D|nr:hypothetical protein [Verrucosispora sp. WMMD573]WBB54417.1 hypothetical protein O7601_28540 [Verrucosispora sp. WMMD573]
MSIGDVKATLRDGTRSLDQAKATVERIATTLAEAQSLTLATLHDSQHSEAEEARRALAAATREVELTLRNIGVAKKRAIAFMDALG